MWLREEQASVQVIEHLLTCMSNYTVKMLCNRRGVSKVFLEGIKGVKGDKKTNRGGDFGVEALIVR